jgi:hypothetical protein
MPNIAVNYMDLLACGRVDDFDAVLRVDED